MGNGFCLGIPLAGVNLGKLERGGWCPPPKKIVAIWGSSGSGVAAGASGNEGVPLEIRGWWGASGNSSYSESDCCAKMCLNRDFTSTNVVHFVRVRG